MHKVVAPKKVDLNTTQIFIDTLDQCINNPVVAVDLRGIEFITPTSMLLIGSKIRRWQKFRREHVLKTMLGRDDKNGSLKYMSHMGFFDYINASNSEGKKMGEAHGSSTYIPIIEIKKPLFVNLQDWYKEIISSVRGLANVLAGTFHDTEEHRFFIYTLREIVRNVFEHSNAENCFICGQRWGNGRVEIGILDEGIGIQESLSKSFRVKDDNQAIKMAIKPGVSSTSHISTDLNQYDNSGYGLYVLTEVVASFGKFSIGSNTRRMTITKNNQKIDTSSFAGTYIGIEMDAAPKQFSTLLKDIIDAGESEAGATKVASSASKMSKLS
jgi:anti-sigma regulatory factor (Ser/Thr protein kinase)